MTHLCTQPRTLTLAISAALTFALPAASSPALSQATTATLFHQVTVFDGTRNIGKRDVLVQNGLIASVAPSITAPSGATIVEGNGRTLAPGLIDAHTHVFGDALTEALSFGVTTELDMFSDPGEGARLRAEQRAGNVATRADLYSAGILATAPKGHGTEYGFAIPTITTPDSAQAFVDARIAEGSDYIKIIYDDGSAYGMHIPTISKETMAAIVRAAHARGKMAVAHIGSLQGARDAINAGVDGLEHLFVDQMPDANFGKFVAAHHAFVVPTLTVLRSTTGVGAADLASDPLLSAYLSPSGRATLVRPFPKFPSAMHYEAAEVALRQLKAAGVPLLAGTDAPNPGTAHGIALHRELELLVGAGLTPTEALAAATSVPARIFKLNDRGRIAAGLRADLVLFNGDPATTITKTRDIAGIWKGGVAVTRAGQAATPVAAASTGPIGPRVISNFDDGSLASSFGTPWVVTTDQMANGKSTATMTVVAGGANGSAKSLSISANVAPGLVYGWGGAMFMPGGAMQPVDLSGTRALHFWAKGDGHTYHVLVFAQSRGYTPITLDFVAGPDWKEYTMPWISFGGIDAHDIMGVAFTAGVPAGAYTFSIDEVGLR